MKKLAALLLVCAPLLAGASAPSCLPSEFGGTGSQYVTGQSARGWWVAYWCPNEKNPTVYACRYASCPSADNIGKAFAKLMTWPSVGTLNSLVPGIGDKYSVSDVWSPDSAKINAVKPK